MSQDQQIQELQQQLQQEISKNDNLRKELDTALHAITSLEADNAVLTEKLKGLEEKDFQSCEHAELVERVSNIEKYLNFNQ